MRRRHCDAPTAADCDFFYQGVPVCAVIPVEVCDDCMDISSSNDSCSMSRFIHVLCAIVGAATNNACQILTMIGMNITTMN